jgi:hypothetical protein
MLPVDGIAKYNGHHSPVTTASDITAVTVIPIINLFTAYDVAVFNNLTKTILFANRT